MLPCFEPQAAELKAASELAAGQEARRAVLAAALEAEERQYQRTKQRQVCGLACQALRRSTLAPLPLIN